MNKFSSVLLVVAALASLARAEVKTKVIEYKHGDVVLEGFLAWDDALATPAKKQPGVVVCPEWWGNNDYSRGRAKKLAELGYVAFAIDMYGKGKLTEDPKQATAWSGEMYGAPKTMRERAAAGLATLVAQPQVDASRVAAIGYCFGGTVALELARSGADLRSVVTFHAGKLAALDDPASNSKIKATLTVCHGDADGFVSAEEIAKFRDEMKVAKVDYEFIAYAGAVHSFTNPDCGKYGIPGIAYQAKADARSWEHMQSAFREAFARK
jgi:dienelactone hydrolase